MVEIDAGGVDEYVDRAERSVGVVQEGLNRFVRADIKWYCHAPHTLLHYLRSRVLELVLVGVIGVLDRWALHAVDRDQGTYCDIGSAARKGKSNCPTDAAGPTGHDSGAFSVIHVRYLEAPRRRSPLGEWLSTESNMTRVSASESNRRAG